MSDGLAAELEPVDEAAELEDAAEDDGAEDLWTLPQPVIAIPTTTVATAQPAAVTRAICMGVSLYVNNSVHICASSAAARAGLSRNAGGTRQRL